MKPRAWLAVSALLLAGAALISCSSAPRQPESVITVKSQADQDMASGQAYYRQGRYQLALQFFSNALTQYTSVDDGEGIVRAYNAVGRCYIALGSPDDAEGVFLRARERARVENAGALLFDSSTNLAELYLSKGDAPRARAILMEELPAVASRTPNQAAQLYHDLGTAEKNLGASPAALDYFSRSLKINLDGKFYAEAASDYYMIASVHSRDGRYEEAAASAALALSYDKRMESTPGIAKDLYALGVIASKKGDQSAAFDWFQRSYLVFTTLGFKEDMRKSLAGLVAAAEALGRTSEADAYRKALADLGSS